MDVVITHEMSDFDALASCVAAQKLYPGAVVVLGRRLAAPVRDFLALHKDRFETIRWNELDQGAVRRVVIVDVRRKGRLGPFAELLDRAARGEVEVHVYDHHAAGSDDVEASLEVVEPVGSATTLLIERMRAGGIEVDPVEATLFALGILTDTGSLTHGGTTPRDARAYAWLLERGIHLGAVARWLRPPLGDQQREVLAALLAAVRTERFAGVPIGFAIVPVPKSLDGLAEVVTTAVELEGHAALIALFEPPGGRGTQVIARARSPYVDVGDLLGEIGGGGHRAAAAARVKGRPAQEVEASLRAALAARPPRPRVVGEIMSSPVNHVRPEISLRELKASLRFWQHTGAPVVRDGELVGVVSRRDVERAERAGNLDLPVGGFMAHDVRTTSPDTTLEEAMREMVAGDVGRLPVVRGGRVVGILSRTDVLRVLYPDDPAAAARFGGDDDDDDDDDDRGGGSGHGGGQPHLSGVGGPGRGGRDAGGGHPRGSAVRGLMLLLAMVGGATPAPPIAAAQPAGAGAGEVASTPSPTGAQTAAAAGPDDRMERARAYFERGVAFADQERWGEALEFFRRSDELVERASTVFNMGVAQYRLGVVRDAIASLERFLALADPVEDQGRREAATDLLDRLRPAVATLVLTVDPADARVEVDDQTVLGVGRERATQVDPGRRAVLVSAPGHLPRRLVVSVLPGGRVRRAVALDPAPVAPARLRVRSNVDDALIRLDDADVGLGRVDLELAPGPYRVAVRADGYHDYEEALSLDPGERVELTAGLRRRGRLIDEPWFWVVTGVVVAGATAGVTAAVLASDDGNRGPPNDGTTGIVIQALRFR